jgi:hypothetical protein
MSEPTITSNNGEVAVFSNGDRYPRGMVIPSIGYRNIISKDAFKEVFAVNSTLSEAKERLKTPQPSPDGVPIGTTLPSPTRPNVGNLGYNFGERQSKYDADKQEDETN